MHTVSDIHPGNNNETIIIATRPQYTSTDSSQTLVNHDGRNHTSGGDFSGERIDELHIDEPQHATLEDDEMILYDDDNGDDNSDVESQITVIGDNNNNNNTEYQKKPRVEFVIEEDVEFPEGGMRAYLVVFGSFMGLIACFGLMNIVGAIESYIKHNQLEHVNSSTVGWIFSISTFVSDTSCIFSGTYFDRNGTRTMLIVGSVLVCSGLVATASCSSVWQFILAFGVLTSLGNGLLMSPLIGAIAHYFSKRRGLFTSLAASGGGVGGVVFPIMLRSLYDKVGFVWAIRILALIFSFCLSIAILLVKERFNKKEEHKGDSFKERVFAYVSIFDKSTLLDMKFVYCTIGSLFAEISTFSCITYFGSYAIKRGYSINDSYLLITLVNLGTIPGRSLTGYLADKLGRFNVMIIIMLLTVVVNLVMWLPFGASLKVLYGYAILYGIISGAVFSLLPVCCGQISKTSEFGKRYSVMYFFIAFGTLVGIPIAGAIIGDSDSLVMRYNWFIVYTAITAIISAIFYYCSRYCCVGGLIKIKF
jgi:MFS family permease